MNLNNISKILSTAFGVMQAVESIASSFKTKSVIDKKQAYIDGIMTALNVTESIKGDIINDDKFKKLMGDFADVTIQINNFIRDYKPSEVKK